MAEDSRKAVSELAKAFRRAGVPIVRPGRKLRDAASEEPQKEDKPTELHLYGKPLDSWEPRYRAKEQAKVPEIKRTKIPELSPESAQDFEVETRTSVRQKRNKTRNMSLTVSVSEEEAQMIRRYCASKDQSFSSWARSLLFRAMGQNMPARPKKY